MGPIPIAPQAQLISQRRGGSERTCGLAASQSRSCCNARGHQLCQPRRETLCNTPGDGDNDDCLSQGVLSAQVECLCEKQTHSRPLPQKMCPPSPGKGEASYQLSNVSPQLITIHHYCNFYPHYPGPTESPVCRQRCSKGWLQNKNRTEEIQ